MIFALPAALPAQTGPFDTIIGLPVHPLVVHGAVVLLPLAALGVIALVLVKRWRGGFGWLTMAGLAAGAGAAVVAEKSGEALAARVGMPRQHAEWGERLPWLAVTFFVVSLLWFLMARRGGSAVVTVGGVLAGVLALATIAMTVLVGHSGATAAWADRIAAPPATSGGGATAYTMAQVATHNTKESCWAVVSGGVYDLTSWVDRHPGGEDAIRGLCGTDGTAAFTTQHSGAALPTNTLAGFKIGTLG
ncbi:MAG: cytochrome b5 domain-containing protein [Actinomycetales bacterium]|nr:cytochrome b5 domain-containing protein [Actinomycetales bacterium]